MITLAIRTDKPEAELYLLDGDDVINTIKWQAHLQLSDTIHNKIEEILLKEHKSLTDLDRIIIYQGPGSFTGLRIGFSVANALGYGLEIPVIANIGETWLETSLKSNTSLFEPVHPLYGSEPNITNPKK